MIVVDWFLLLIAVVMLVFAFWRVFSEANPSVMGGIESYAVGLIAILLLPHAISVSVEQFNPDLHDCTEHDSNYFLRYGETDSKGNAYALPPDCNELRNNTGGLVGWDCPSHNCVSRQPKPCKSDETPKEVWNSVYATYNCTDVIGLTLATSNINAKHSYIPYPEVQSNCVLDNLSFGGKETICVKKQPSEAVPKNEVKI